MDRDLAGATLRRWELGLPVSEVAFYKAAAVLGVDPGAALTEARFFSSLDRYLASGEPMTDAQHFYFSSAAGEDPGHIEKVASAYRLTRDELVMRKLAAQRFNPSLEKIALMVPPEVLQQIMQQQGGGGDAGGQQGQQGGGQGQEGAQPSPEEAAAAAGPQGPMEGAQLQQDPAARFKPAPTAPDQVAPGPGGNLDALLQEIQGIHGQQAEENGGLPPTGAEEPPPPPPAPEERIQQVAPGMDPETTGRYAQKLTEFEQEMGMAISDPKQMVKFVQSLQKVDGKYIDEGIKQMTQKWEQEMGIGQTVQGASPTVPGFGGGAGGAAGGAGAGAGGGAGGAGGKPEVQPGQPLPAAQAAGTKPKQPQPQQPGAGAEATKKIAHAAEALARIASAG